jgi:hypothetical protein
VKIREAYSKPHAYGVGFLCDQGKGLRRAFRGLPLAIPGVAGLWSKMLFIGLQGTLLVLKAYSAG